MKRSLVRPTAGAAAVMLLALTAACSSSSSSSSASGGSTTTGGSTSGKSYKMTFIQGVAGDGFYVTMGCGIQAEAKKIGNITVNIQGPSQFDATLQNPIIQSVTAAKPDAILIAPNDVSASRPPIAAAMAAGIKVVLVDTTLTDPSGAVSQISSDNLAGGGYAFRAIQQLVPGGGEVLVVNVKPGISTTDQRSAGLRGRGQGRPEVQVRRHAVRPGQRVHCRAGHAGGAAEESRHRRHLRDQPVLRRGRRHRCPPGRQVRQGEDRRIRRRARSGHRAAAGNRAGAHRPASVRHRDQRGGPGLRGPHRQADHREDRHQVHHHHQGQPERRRRARQRSTRPAADLRPPAYCPANGPPVPCTGGPLAAGAARLDPDHAVATSRRQSGGDPR